MLFFYFQGWDFVYKSVCFLSDFINNENKILEVYNGVLKAYKN